MNEDFDKACDNVDVGQDNIRAQVPNNSSFVSIRGDSMSDYSTRSKKRTSDQK